VALGFMMAHPGKKLLFMGQDFAQISEWNEEKSLDWELLNTEQHAQMNRYFRELNKFYSSHPAMYQMDFVEDGFEWLSNMDADHSIIVFTRKTTKIEDTLLIVCNFTPVAYQGFSIGVPFTGKYKEVFNSDKELYGGKGNLNSRLKQSKNKEMDGRDHSIILNVPPLGISIFTCTPTEDEKIPVKKKSSKKEK
jgi:1,4-alpha-glucan branching enzyme